MYLGGKIKKRALVPGKKVLQTVVIGNVQKMPVIQSGPADSLLRDVEPQGAHQVEPAAGGGAGAGDIPAVLGDLRFDQDNVQHRMASPSFPYNRTPL